MKTQQQWFKEYAVSHQNKTNKAIHYVCVPAIFFSIVGLVMCIPTTFLINNMNINNRVFLNWASVALLFLALFYFNLSFKTGIKMLLFSITCIIGNYFISIKLPLIYISLAIFVVAWIGQFYGHKLEGKKPSFFKDLQFLLIGPAWVFEKISIKK